MYIIMTYLRPLFKYGKAIKKLNMPQTKFLCCLPYLFLLHFLSSVSVTSILLVPILFFSCLHLVHHQILLALVRLLFTVPLYSVQITITSLLDCSNILLTELSASAFGNSLHTAVCQHSNSVKAQVS